jgi:hypothetical protein
MTAKYCLYLLLLFVIIYGVYTRRLTRTLEENMGLSFLLGVVSLIIIQTQ